MKKTIGGAALLVLLATAAQAQIAPGTILLGGTMRYSAQSREGTLANTDQTVKLAQTNQFTISPTVGYFLSENLAVGLNLSYSHLKTTDYQYIVAVPVSGSGLGSVIKNGRIESKGPSFSVGPVARYYAFVGEKAAFFGQLGAGFWGDRTESKPEDVLVGSPSSARSTGSGYYAQLAPGFVFFPTPKFGLEVSLQGLMYQRGESKTEITSSIQPKPVSQESTNSSFAAGLGLSNLQIGAAFYLGR
ncbi:outer membrane beta-barrel protein [Hymenobacter lucidus]|uniref:Outer membrane beta-barrel protein n=1 Tax=Hymenobacter lucidus TaxID=2880930 RepID=A0ABS8AXB0_9BACT|nr:outer membrane beta-barrel protein [Hymenobacter lucidus]MCB2410451.1 outer membrane beta-barrel protein [Hymenobacter lucidus]